MIATPLKDTCQRSSAQGWDGKCGQLATHGFDQRNAVGKSTMEVSKKGISSAFLDPGKTGKWFQPLANDTIEEPFLGCLELKPVVPSRTDEQDYASHPHLSRE